MAKWNWLKGLRCVAGISATMLVAGTAMAGDGIADPDAVFQQTSFATTCGADGSCGADDKGDAGCRSDGCDGGLSGLLDWGLCCDQEKFFDPFNGAKVGGWVQLGYSDEITLFNGTGNATGPADQNGRVLLNQGWLYLERAAESECGEWAWGYRADFVYGADATNTQAFGNNPGQFDIDAGFQHGDREAWAIPQLYVEVTNGDWTVKGGHFYTLHGYEVVTAPDNFFYSHAYTMNNSEPFTHTGFVASHDVSEDTTIYGGWTAGWDTGFDQANGGSNFLGGFSTDVSDDLNFTYITSFGDFGAGRGEGGYAHSIVADYQIDDCWNYVLTSDLVRDGADNDVISLNHYLIYQVSDCVGLGVRNQWWKNDGQSVNAFTFGANVRPHSQIVIRPELRYDWSPGGTIAADGTGGINGVGAGDVNGSNATTFAVDVILTFSIGIRRS